MKKTLFFLLFCGLGFFAGYLVGIPFSKTPSIAVSGTQRNPENVENLGHQAIALTPQTDTPEGWNGGDGGHRGNGATFGEPLVQA